MSWQIVVGEIVSITVTVEVQLLELPLTSVTVKVTTFAPTSAHVNDVAVDTYVAIPQASELPLSMSFAVNVTLPVLSKYALIS